MVKIVKEKRLGVRSVALKKPVPMGKIPPSSPLFIKLFFRKLSFLPLFLLFTIFSILFFSIAYQLIAKTASFPLDGTDFRAIYTGGVMIIHGVSSDFYSLSTQFFWQKTIFNLPSEIYLMPFTYPPFAALFISLLANFPLSTAYIIFATINIVLAIIAFYFLIFSTGKKSFTQTIILFLFFICFYPIWIALSLGQWSFILLLSFISASYFFSKNKKFLAGLGLSLLLIRLNLLFLPIFLLIIKRQWKMLSGLGLGIFILTLISYVLIGFNGLKTYIELLASIPFWGDKFTVHPTLEPTLRGFLQSLLRTNSILPVLPFFVLGALLTILFVKKSLLGLNISSLLTVTLFTSIHTNYHDLVLLLLPCIFILMSIKKIPLMIVTALGMSLLINASLFRPELSVLLFIFILSFYADCTPHILRQFQSYLRKLLDSIY